MKQLSYFESCLCVIIFNKSLTCSSSDILSSSGWKYISFNVDKSLIRPFNSFNNIFLASLKYLISTLSLLALALALAFSKLNDVLLPNSSSAYISSSHFLLISGNSSAKS